MPIEPFDYEDSVYVINTIFDSERSGNAKHGATPFSAACLGGGGGCGTHRGHRRVWIPTL